MKGREVVFRAKDAKTGEPIELACVLRDGVYDEESKCFHVIVDKVNVPVKNIVSARRIDLFSTEQQLLMEILQTLKALDEKMPGMTDDPKTPKNLRTCRTAKRKVRPMHKRCRNSELSILDGESKTLTQPR